MKEREGLKGKATSEKSAAELKWWQIFWGMIVSPAQVFRQTQGQASLVIPAILIPSAAAFAAVAFSIAQQDGVAASAKNLVIGAVIAAIGMLVTWAVSAGFFHFLLLVLGGKGNFRQALNVFGWAWIPVFFGTVGKGIYALITGSAPSTQEPGLLGAFLSSTDVFSVWNMVLLTIGFSTVFGIAKTRAAIPVVGLWLLGVIAAYSGSSV